MGGEDPAVAALRQRLAAQNAATAQAVAASQQGVNPALAQRNAQQALTQQQIATNSELARAGMASAGQARKTDAVGRRRDMGLQAGGALLNTFGTMMGVTEAGNTVPGADPAGQALASPQLAQQALVSAVAPPPMQTQTFPGGESGMALAAPSASPLQAQVPMGPDGQPLFDPNAPSAAGGSPQGQLQPGSPPPLGGNLGPQASYGAPPAQSPAPGVPPIAVPPITPTLPQPTIAAPASQVLSDAASARPAGVSPQGQLQPGAGPATPTPGAVGPQPGAVPPPSDPRTWASPQERQLPAAPPVGASAALDPSITSNPQNAGLLQMYDEAVASGNTAAARALLNILQTPGI